MSLDEIMRKKKGKEPEVTQSNPPEQQPRKSPSPVPSPTPSKAITPPSTGTTPPPQDTTTQTHTQPEKEPTKEQDPPIDQPQEINPPTPSETINVATNIVLETGTMQDLNESPKEKEVTEEGAKNAATTEVAAIGATAPEQHPPVVTTVIAGNIDETLNLVVIELAEKKRQDLSNTQKFFKHSTVKEAKESVGGEGTVKGKELNEGATKEKESGKSTKETEESTLKEVAEVLKDLPETVLETPAKQSKKDEVQSSAQAPDPSAPDSDKPSRTAALKTSSSGSKTPKSKQKKPKQTPTRSSSRLRSGAKPQ